VMPAPWQTDLAGPWVPFPLTAFREEDLEPSVTVPQDDHHGGRGLRFQLRLRELNGQEELPQAIEGRFRHATSAHHVRGNSLPGARQPQDTRRSR